MKPSECYEDSPASSSSEEGDNMDTVPAKNSIDSATEPQSKPPHYFVADEDSSNDQAADSTDCKGEDESMSTTADLFPLPQIQRPTRRSHKTKPLVDYTKSIIMTSK